MIGRVTIEGITLELTDEHMWRVTGSPMSKEAQVYAQTLLRIAKNLYRADFHYIPGQPTGIGAVRKFAEDYGVPAVVCCTAEGVLGLVD